MTVTRFHARGRGGSHYNRGCRCHECRDAHNHRQLAWTRRNPEKRDAIRHGSCPECGGRMSVGNGTGRDPERCLDCHQELVRSRLKPCGTMAAYSRGCRCDECRAAWRDYFREMSSKPPPTHGQSGYQNYGCRCDICKAAGSEANRRARARRKARQAA